MINSFRLSLCDSTHLLSDFLYFVLNKLIFNSNLKYFFLVLLKMLQKILLGCQKLTDFFFQLCNLCLILDHFILIFNEVVIKINFLVKFLHFFLQRLTVFFKKLFSVLDKRLCSLIYFLYIVVNVFMIEHCRSFVHQCTWIH